MSSAKRDMYMGMCMEDTNMHQAHTADSKLDLKVVCNIPSSLHKSTCTFKKGHAHAPATEDMRVRACNFEHVRCLLLIGGRDPV
eukprot:1152250-Pelagomonas_calceolata.AAC.1